jgi:hypothetical protein
MSGQTFPDALPPAYSERYGPGRLHDTKGPEPGEPWVIEQTRDYAEKNIAALKAQTQDVWRWE